MSRFRAGKFKAELLHFASRRRTVKKVIFQEHKMQKSHSLKSSDATADEAAELCQGRDEVLQQAANNRLRR